MALEVESVVTITDGSAKRKSQSLPTIHGLERRQTSLLLPVAGELFFLDSPLYRTALSPTSVLDAHFPVSDKPGICGSLFVTLFRIYQATSAILVFLTGREAPSVPVYFSNLAALYSPYISGVVCSALFYGGQDEKDSNFARRRPHVGNGNPAKSA